MDDHADHAAHRAPERPGDHQELTMSSGISHIKAEKEQRSSSSPEALKASALASSPPTAGRAGESWPTPARSSRYDRPAVLPQVTGRLTDRRWQEEAYSWGGPGATSGASGDIPPNARYDPRALLFLPGPRAPHPQRPSPWPGHKTPATFLT